MQNIFDDEVADFVKHHYGDRNGNLRDDIGRRDERTNHERQKKNYPPIFTQKFARQKSQFRQDDNYQRQLKNKTERQDEHYHEVEVTFERKNCLQVLRPESHEKF